VRSISATTGKSDVPAATMAIRVGGSGGSEGAEDGRARQRIVGEPRPRGLGQGGMPACVEAREQAARCRVLVDDPGDLIHRLAGTEHGLGDADPPFAILIEADVLAVGERHRPAGL
jgi:hypothetical protein